MTDAEINREGLRDALELELTGESRLMTPGDMRNEALHRVEESDRLNAAVSMSRLSGEPLSVDQESAYRHVAHLRQTAIVFAVLAGVDS